jgi:hypothetical protein
VNADLDTEAPDDKLSPRLRLGLQAERIAADRMCSGVAHEINNSLSPVALYVESLLATDTTLSVRARLYLSTIQRSVQDVVHSVARMVEFHHLLKPQRMLSLVDLGAVAEASWLKMREMDAGKIGYDLSIEFDPALPPTIGVESDIGEAFVAMFSRGMNDRPGLGPLKILGYQMGHEIIVEVDGAPGVPCLRFTIAGRTSNDGASELNQPSLRILLVDDDQSLLAILSEALSREGHNVVVARGGSEGIARFKVELAGPAPFQAVITDLEMPGVDGRQVIAEVKESAPTVPVFLLTGWTDRGAAQPEHPLNVQGLLHKPPTIAELRRALATVEPVIAEGAGRVLVVEDEESLLTAICELLRTKGYAVTGAVSGRSALETLATRDFDVLLTDLVMPDMGGLELIQSVIRLHPTVVSIVMTAHGTIAGAIEALQAGAMDYVLKPFKLGALLPILRRALTVRRLRQENAALERRVREHAAELEGANQELESFSYSVSHDLRAPLRVIRGFAEALTEDYTVSPPNGGELLLRIVRGADRMDALIAALLGLSAVARQPLARERIDMFALAQAIGTEVTAENPSWKGQIAVKALPECDADSALVRQIFTNLISNAVKFTRDRETPKVEIGFQIEGGTCSYFVRDNGVGFEQAQAERAFLAFSRLHSPTQFAGSGIGLSIVHRIVVRHGGRIWAESQPDHGATFHFTLNPIRQEL